jgi:SAM-dependent methyltransferase
MHTENPNLASQSGLVHHGGTVKANGFDISVSEASSLHGMIQVEGWVRHASDFITGVRPSISRNAFVDADAQFPDGGIVSADHALRFRCRFAVPRGADPLAVSLSFKSRRRQRFSLPLRDLVEEARLANPVSALQADFAERLERTGPPRILDIGGRDRSDVGYTSGLEQHATTVLDIYAGAGVDVVGDAHRLSEYFPPESFDAITSTATFEHLFMPWKVVLEMNRVLSPGGIVMILTHQSIGMHDEPNDFWRYTQHGWAALFNEATGFEIIRSAMGRPMLLLPRLLPEGTTNFEDAVGYYDCAVLARRAGEARVDWPVDPPSELQYTYPTD